MSYKKAVGLGIVFYWYESPTLSLIPNSGYYFTLIEAFPQ